MTVRYAPVEIELKYEPNPESHERCCPDDNWGIRYSVYGNTQCITYPACYHYSDGPEWAHHCFSLLH